MVAASTKAHAPVPIPPVLGRLHKIEMLVTSLIASWHTSGEIIQSRRGHRLPFREPLLITQFDDRTEQPVGPSQPVTGRDLSLHGISFTHPQLMPSRHVIVTIEIAPKEYESVLTRLLWCRFTRDRIYYSGGLFIRTVQLSPVETNEPNSAAH